MRDIMKMKKLHIIVAIVLCSVIFSAATAAAQNAETLMISASQAFAGENYKEAKGYCLQVLEKEPDNDAAYFLLARISLMENDIQSGENFLKKAIALDSTNYYYSSMLAPLYLKEDKIEEAKKLYESLVKQFPGKTEPYMNLINISTKEGDFDRVFSIADKLDKMVGQNEVSTMARFNAYTAKRQYPMAVKCLQDADAASPNPRYETLLGDMSMDRFNDTAALRYYNKALIQDSLYAPALFGKAELYRLKSDYPNFFKNLIPFMANEEINPKNKADYFKQIFANPGFIARYKNEMSEAMQAMAKANPDDSTCNQIAAIYLSGAGKKEEAKKILKNNLEHYPDDYGINVDYMSFLYSSEDWKGLKNFGDSIVNKFPGKTDMLQFKGLAEYNLKLYDESIATLSQVEQIARAKKDTTLLLNAYSLIGDLYHLKNQNEESYKVFKKALKLNPKESPVLNNWAWYIATSDKNGNLDKALKMSKITIDQEPDNSTYLDTYGWILYLQKNYTEARKQFQHALAYGGSDNPVMLDHYSEVLFALKEYDLAFLYWDKAVEASKKQGDTEQTEKLLKKIESRKEMSKNK